MHTSSIWHHHFCLGEKPLFRQLWSLWLLEGWKWERRWRGREKRRGGGRCLQTLAVSSWLSKTAFGVFCEAVGLFVSHRLIRPSVLPSLSSGGEVLWSGRYLCERVCSGNISLIKFPLPNPSGVSSIPSGPHTHARARRDPLLIFLADTSLSGRSLCHHGNPASPHFSAHSASEEHVDELPGSHQWLLVCKQTHTRCTAAEMWLCSLKAHKLCKTSCL